MLLSISNCCYPLIKLHRDLLANFVDFVSMRGSTKFKEGAVPRLLPVGILALAANFLQHDKNVVLEKPAAKAISSMLPQLHR